VFSAFGEARVVMYQAYFKPLLGWSSPESFRTGGRVDKKDELIML
jgi:hypothetical protein